MRNPFLVGVLTSTLVLASTSAAAEQASPSPTPTAKPTRKLGGGSFGNPNVPTPTGGAPDAKPGDARPTQVEQPLPVGKPSRSIVITNESLGKAEPTPAGTSITISGKPGSKPSVKAAPTPKAVVPPSPIPEYRDATGRTEADWRVRASQIRERIDRSAADISAAQAEVRRLENDFYAWSDGNYRERVIRPAWDQAKEKVKSLETEAENARAAMADLEDEARRSGTPPGWLR